MQPFLLFDSGILCMLRLHRLQRSDQLLIQQRISLDRCHLPSRAEQAALVAAIDNNDVVEILRFSGPLRGRNRSESLSPA